MDQVPVLLLTSITKLYFISILKLLRMEDGTLGILCSAGGKKLSPAAFLRKYSDYNTNSGDLMTQSSHLILGLQGDK